MLKFIRRWKERRAQKETAKRYLRGLHGYTKPMIVEIVRPEPLSYEESLEKELEEYKMIIGNWFDAYAKHIIGKETDLCLLEDFLDDITRFAQPKLWRLYECEHLSPKEYKDFQLWIMEKVLSFKEKLKEVRDEKESK